MPPPGGGAKLRYLSLEAPPEDLKISKNHKTHKVSRHGFVSFVISLALWVLNFFLRLRRAAFYTFKSKILFGVHALVSFY